MVFFLRNTSYLIDIKARFARFACNITSFMLHYNNTDGPNVKPDRIGHPLREPLTRVFKAMAAWLPRDATRARRLRNGSLRVGALTIRLFSRCQHVSRNSIKLSSKPYFQSYV